MGATSVTGKGQGAAYNLKGPSNSRNFLVPMVNPHIVAAGSVALSGGAATVIVGGVDTTTNYYIVLANDASGTAAAVSASQAVSSGTLTITLAGSGTNTVKYAVVRMTRASAEVAE